MSTKHQPIWCQEFIEATSSLPVGQGANIMRALIQTLPSSFLARASFLFSSLGWCSDNCLWGRITFPVCNHTLFLQLYRASVVGSQPLWCCLETMPRKRLQHIPSFVTDPPPEVGVVWGFMVQGHLQSWAHHPNSFSSLLWPTLQKIEFYQKPKATGTSRKFGRCPQFQHKHFTPDWLRWLLYKCSVPPLLHACNLP